MEKLHIDKLILVEGKYDKIRLENIVDSKIIILNGFGIFNNRKQIETIKSLANDKDVLLLTDSDTAGYKIRVYLSKVLSSNKIINVFIPQIVGKEKRKAAFSAEGYLGVEGIDDTVLRELLAPYTEKNQNKKGKISISDLYLMGYTGSCGAKMKKNSLLEYLGVQSNLSNNFLLNILNERYTLEEFIVINDSLTGRNKND